MTEIDSKSPETMEATLKLRPAEIYQEYRLTPRTDNYKVMFSDLIEKLARQEEFVPLIDEYDRPMLNHLGDPEMAKAIRVVMAQTPISNWSL
jgi:hypothetical protein